MSYGIQKNAGGALNRMSIYYNDNGVVKTPSKAFFNKNGEVIEFPKLDKCVFNLDATSWIGGNSIYNSNSFIDKDLYDFRVFNGEGDGTELIGKITNNVRVDQSSVNDSVPDFITPRYRFLGMSRREFNKTFVLKNGKFGEGGKISFHIKIKADRTPEASWWNPIIFKNNWNARLEIGADRDFDLNFYTEGNQAAPQILGKWSKGSIINTAQTATICIDSINKNVSYFINGVNIGNVGCNFEFNPVDRFTIHNKRGGISMLAPLRYYSIRVWNDFLSGDDVVAINKIDGMI